MFNLTRESGLCLTFKERSFPMVASTSYKKVDLFLLGSNAYLLNLPVECGTLPIFNVADLGYVKLGLVLGCIGPSPARTIDTKCRSGL